MPLPTQPVTNELNPERLRAIIYGDAGAGKTTLSAGWYPQTNLLIDLEGSTAFLPGQHFVVRPGSYSEFVAVVNELAQGGHHYKTVTIDTIDHLVRMADSEAGQRGGKVAAGLVEFGKGMADRDGVIMRELTKLLATDLGVLINAHATKLTVTTAEGQETERLFPRIEAQDRIRQPIMGLVDFVLLVRKHPNETRDLVTGGVAGAETKRRVALPNVMPADAGELYAAVKAGIDQLQQPQLAAA